MKKAIFGSISLVIFLGISSSVRVNAQALPRNVGFEPGITRQTIDERYLLGPGDRLSLTFFNVPEYDGEEQILVDGSINLPLIGDLNVSGLSLEDATEAIEVAYSLYLKTPKVSVDLVTPRPMRVGISGEVNRPGTYDIPLVTQEMDGVIDWPTVIEIIQLSGGITDQANVRQVEIRRPQALGGEAIIALNIWDILMTGNIQNDITLRHGDAIYIPTARELTPEELTQLSAANFSPNSIQVTVVGEVPTPGAVDIPPNAPLNQALLAAGGFDPRRAKTDEVTLVRLNSDGTVSQRNIPINFDEGINEDTNPTLRNNDVVMVGRSSSAAFSDSVSGVAGPVGAILSPFRLLMGLFD
ncbi:MAG: polysaccharide biosynthesis/export family protein [Cyanobacteria bacterium P01_F01_bin.150]